ncbi:MAG: acyltransferase, partial [Lachnospiraceae bacterium]|nr:acyltransferase [Lachnospiraceae bacterium]
MSIVSLQLYPLLLLVLILWGAKVSRKEIAAEFWSVDQTKMMQGVLCICVVLHHVTQEISSYGSRNVGPITWFSDIGFLFTGIFFFISGYGLVTNLLHRPDYLKHFIPKRLGAVLIPFWFVNLLLVMAGIFIFGDHKTTLRGVMEVFGLRLVNSNGWYIVEIVLFYLMFYLLCYCIKNKDVALVLLSVFALAIIRYAFFTGHDPTGQNATWFRGEWWYNATIMFVVGLWYARFREKANGVLERGYKVILPVVAILTVASMYASRYVLGRYGYYHEQLAFGHRDALITLLVQCVSCVIFTLLVVLLNMRITIGNPILRYLSKISMTLFLVHGFFVHRVFAEVHMSDFLRYAAILATGIACASIVAPVTRFLSKQAIEY